MLEEEAHNVKGLCQQAGRLLSVHYAKKQMKVLMNNNCEL
jgi:hypothetical protein